MNTEIVKAALFAASVTTPAYPGAGHPFMGIDALRELSEALDAVSPPRAWRELFDTALAYAALQTIGLEITATDLALADDETRAEATAVFWQTFDDQRPKSEAAWAQAMTGWRDDEGGEQPDA